MNPHIIALTLLTTAAICDAGGLPQCTLPEGPTVSVTATSSLPPAKSYCPCNGNCDCPHCLGLTPICPCGQPGAKNSRWFSQGYWWEWDVATKKWWWWNTESQLWYIYQARPATAPAAPVIQQFVPMGGVIGGGRGGFIGGGGRGGC